MRKIIEFANRFRREEDGAAMIEYTVLLGIITAAVIVTIIAVGGWVSGQWGNLNTQLQTVPAGGTGGGSGSGSGT
ncbi:Flp family type IVb pilin [Mesorhizobium sp. VNQ89]|uniref:Flp family type IVb pilin n=1 Tax=Mesorhizobium quangtriensis TaxID=3157709 RepID=UPI0032B87AC5